MNNLQFHHIGIATKDIKKEFEHYKMLGYSAYDDIFVDKIQKIRGLFIKADTQPMLELLENIEEAGPLTPYLKKGVKLYHFAYITTNIENDCKELVKNGAIPVVPITDAAYFKKICFLMLKNMMLIELVEQKTNID